MKYALLAIAVLGCMMADAQQKDSLSFIEFTPFYTNNIANSPYTAKLESSEPLIQLTKRESPIKKKYSGGSLGVKGYFKMKRRMHFIMSLDLSVGFYKSSLAYSFYDASNTIVNKTNNEEITGMSSGFKLGIGKFFYLDAAQRILFIPEVLVGASISTYLGTYTAGNYSGNYTYGKDQIRIGTELNMKLVYMLGKAFALGITLPEITSYNMVLIEERFSDGSTSKENRPVFTFGQLLKPRLNFIFYL
jgi:hypothetical protein